MNESRTTTDLVDYYKTNPEDVIHCLNQMKYSLNTKTVKVLDVGCATGIWGECFAYKYPSIYYELYGIDIQNFDKNEVYHNWITGDFLQEKFDTKFDYIIGNPPFNLAQGFIEKSYSLLNENGQLNMILRLSFLESKSRYEFWQKHKPKKVSIFAVRPSFVDSGKRYTTAIASYVWQKGYSGGTQLDWIKNYG